MLIYFNLFYNYLFYFIKNSFLHYFNVTYTNNNIIMFDYIGNLFNI